jgi:putative peptidoglycan lipid II flippase
MENQQQTSSRIARSTAVVALAFATAKAISLLQTFIIARTFGVGYEYDAFVTANRAPELIVTLIAGGSLGFAFIPIFSGLLGQGKREDAWEVASHVINTVFLAALILSALTFAIAPWLVGVVYAPGFPRYSTPDRHLVAHLTDKYAGFLDQRNHPRHLTKPQPFPFTRACSDYV